MERLEQACQGSIYEHRETWFDGDMDKHDIENYFTPPMKLYKSGKFYILRTNVSLVLGKPTLTVYDEDATKVSMESIVENTNVMTILEIQGIKCSARSFQIEIELKQMMIMQPSTIFNTCLLAPKKQRSVANEVQSQDQRSVANELQDLQQKKETVEEPIEELLAENTPIYAKLQEEEQEPEQEITVIDESDKDDSSAIYLAKTLDKEENGELAELSIHLDDSSETMTLKNRNEVHYEIYAEARKKAREARDNALASYLEAKRIKNLYMLDELSSEENEPIL
jgi:hypothetical protein